MMRIGYRGFLLALLPALGLAACGITLSSDAICAAQMQYAAVCGTSYIEASCRHYATCSFALYKPELLVAQYQCLSQNVDAKSCGSATCAALANVESTLSQTQTLGPSATAFAQSCAAKSAECSATPQAQLFGDDLCQPSPLLLDQVFTGLTRCATEPCDQYGSCLNAQLALTLGPGCLSFSREAVP